VTGRAGHAGFSFAKFGEGHFSGLDIVGEAPEIGAGANVAAVEFAVEHGATGNDDGGDVATGGAHDQGGRGFVAAAHEDDAVDGIGANAFFDVHADEIAEEHGGGAKIGFASGHDGEFEGEAARFPDAAFDAFGEGAEMRIAGSELGPGVADTDDRAAVENVWREALVLHPAAVDESVFAVTGEPLGGAECFIFSGHECSGAGVLLCEDASASRKSIHRMTAVYSANALRIVG